MQKASVPGEPRNLHGSAGFLHPSPSRPLPGSFLHRALLLDLGETLNTFLSHFKSDSSHAGEAQGTHHSLPGVLLCSEVLYVVTAALSFVTTVLFKNTLQACYCNKSLKVRAPPSSAPPTSRLQASAYGCPSELLSYKYASIITLTDP